MQAGGLGITVRVAAKAPAAALLCSALIATGCGSSGSGSSSASSGSGGSTAASASTGAAAKSSSGGLKYDTTPKYAKPSSSEPVRSGVVQVEYRNYAINPDTVRVKAGATVRWTNYDEQKCNVVSKGGPDHFASKDFGEGENVEYKLENPGVVHYECTSFPTTMNGTIEVVK